VPVKREEIEEVVELRVIRDEDVTVITLDTIPSTGETNNPSPIYLSTLLPNTSSIHPHPSTPSTPIHPYNIYLNPHGTPTLITLLNYLAIHLDTLK
jgi:hypothetical protein